ncbi:hypothetical protein EV663_10617 [Rhodovulum bhavnagarense]|uniref:Uncharacterized protein n=1 Tax=Rhodovulum bhavnagarense TaxID=992286 RepID=A0A4R2RMT5_9RHOB|nr:hypothetical protein EV663_10617 [Rhodovulum bhavnagarense]
MLTAIVSGSSGRTIRGGVPWLSAPRERKTGAAR